MAAFNEIQSGPKFLKLNKHNTKITGTKIYVQRIDEHS